MVPCASVSAIKSSPQWACNAACFRTACGNGGSFRSSCTRKRRRASSLQDRSRIPTQSASGNEINLKQVEKSKRVTDEAKLGLKEARERLGVAREHLHGVVRALQDDGVAVIPGTVRELRPWLVGGGGLDVLIGQDDLIKHGLQGAFFILFFFRKKKKKKKKKKRNEPKKKIIVSN